MKRFGIRRAFGGRPWNKLRFGEKLVVVAYFLPAGFFLGFLEIAIWIDTELEREEPTPLVQEQPNKKDDPA